MSQAACLSAGPGRQGHGLTLAFFLPLLAVFTADSGIFGVPLTVLLDNDRKKDPEVKVPLVLQKVSPVLKGGESEVELTGCFLLRTVEPLQR